MLGTTRGEEGILKGKDLPGDLEEQAKGSRLYRQYAPGVFGSMARPLQLPASNLDLAFEPELVTAPGAIR